MADNFEDVFEKLDEIGEILEIKPVNHVAFILDCSGSMWNIREKSLWSFNEQLQSLKKESHDQDTYVTLTMFNDDVDIKYLDKKIDCVEELKEYNTNGMTALYDAIGMTIEKLNPIVKVKENHSALIFIITDGYNNPPNDNSRKEIKDKIETLEKKGNWTFVFLGANIDVQEVSVKGMAINLNNSVSFDSCNAGVEAASETLTSGIATYYSSRRSGHTQTKNFFSGGGTGDGDGYTGGGSSGD